MTNTESYFINLGSMTQAMNADSFLKSAGIECTVGKSSEKSTVNGCAWGVYIKKEKRETALNVLRIHSLHV